ncbi:Amidase (plasmid) [Cupriavidus taiwanensis]|uniref:Amidase n=1 Tax=Cupriavidus taiwanensis TaxID=164546 RepID=A0A9Q7XU48_9BURK|nr:amidase [Cupriavidus taiwanensis]SPD67388.1 Amidase [Cupriavidus taiwanensis]
MNLPDWTTGGFPPLWEVAQRLADGTVSSEQLVDACEAARRQWHGIINAMVLSDFDAARAAARDSDRRRRAGQARGVLDGVPFSVKESFDVAGWPTTCGNPALRGHVAGRDAVVVQRLRDAGAILLGKTNVPLGLRDWQSYNAIYGTTRNPHDPARTPGGSSGGSAAAVCAGLSFFDVGSDIGSSLRNPAHYCGIFSLKPSHGLVPLAGHGTGAARFGEQDINVAGPLARSARDLEPVLRVIAGPDGDDALPYRLQWPQCPHRRLADFRIAVLPTHAQAEADGEVATQIGQLGHWLAEQGAHVGWHERPDFDAGELWHAYVTLLRATTSVHMDDTAFADALARSATATVGDRDYATLQYTGATLHHRDWLRLQVARERFAAAWRSFFTRYDVLLCPAAATTAFALDEAGEPWQRTLSVNGAPQPMTTQLFWAGHSGLCGLPSAVAPIGPGAGGLPVGVQIVAGRYRDLTALRFACLLEEAGYAYRPPRPTALPAAHHT